MTVSEQMLAIIVTAFVIAFAASFALFSRVPMNGLVAVDADIINLFAFSVCAFTCLFTAALAWIRRLMAPWQAPVITVFTAVLAWIREMMAPWQVFAVVVTAFLLAFISSFGLLSLEPLNGFLWQAVGIHIINLFAFSVVAFTCLFTAVLVWIITGKVAPL